MTLNVDLKDILKSLEQINEELLKFNKSKPLSFKDAQDQLKSLKLHLKTSLEISEKLLKYFSTAPNSSPAYPATEDQPKINWPEKFENLQKLYEFSELSLTQHKVEIQYLRTENEKLSNSLGANNLFSVEVYQSEIDDLKKDHSEKLAELEGKHYKGKIKRLESSSSNRKYFELQKKYNMLKEQLSIFKKKVASLEDAVDKNNEFKRVTMSKYYELVNTHKKMFEYVEKLEVKMKKFQEGCSKRNSCNSSMLSRENSFSFYSRLTEESRSFNLSVSGPMSIFSI